MTSCVMTIELRACRLSFFVALGLAPIGGCLIDGPKTCRFPGGFEFSQGSRPLVIGLKSPIVTDDPPGLHVVVTLEEPEESAEMDLVTEGTLEHGFTLATGGLTGPPYGPCPDALLFAYSYTLVLPPSWDSSVGDSFPPVLIESELDELGEVHTLWNGWTVAVTPDMEWM